MNLQVGKSIGIALLLAAGLLAALLAMGVFSESGVDAHDVDPAHTHPTVTWAIFDSAGTELDTGEISTDSMATSTTIMVTTRVLIPLEGTMLRFTSPAGTELASPMPADSDTTTPAIDIDVSGREVSGPTQATMTVQDSVSTDNTVAATNFETAEITVNITYRSAVSVNTDTAGDDVRLTFTATLEADVGDLITIEMPGFGLPDEIDADDVTVNGAHPATVEVDGDAIVLTVGDDIGDIERSAVTIRFSSRAGITNPTTADDYEVTIKDDNEDVVAESLVTVPRGISLDPDSGASGGDVTVTGTGFSGDSVTVFIDKTPGESGDDATEATDPTYESDGMFDADVDVILARAVNVEDGEFTLVTDGITKPEGDDAMVYVSAIDGDGNLPAEAAAYEFEAGITVEPDSASWGETVTITLVDWTAGDVTHVRFGGSSDGKVEVETASDSEVEAEVPAGLRTGNLKVEVYTGENMLVSGVSGSIEIVSQSLNVSPSTVVPGQQVTITGSGFGDSEDVSEVTIGGKDAEVPDDASSTSAGRVAVTVTVPLDVGSGSKKVILETENGRQGETTITVGGPSITVIPSESLIGSTITVSGSGFASDERIEILYDGDFEGFDETDGNGNFSAEIEVPEDAGIGRANDVKVQVRNDTSISATATHRTPTPVITVTSEAWAGGTITITGANFAGFSVLSEVEVGALNALPSPAPETDIDGRFSFQVRVPRLSLGSHTVTVKDSGDPQNSATEVFTVVEEPEAPAIPDSVELSANPSTAVPGQHITLAGSGFGDSEAVTEITIGGHSVEMPAGAASASDGSIEVTVHLPLGIGAGDKDVVLTVASGQQGEGMITVPEPSITVTPEESPIGSAINVAGSGFASGERVEVFYNGAFATIGMADGSGDFTISMTVPPTAGTGQTNMVEVLVIEEASIKASADHKTPDPEPVIPDPVELSAEPSTAVPGQHITITGSGLGDSEAVTEITIGGQSVEAPADAASASDGSIEVTVHLPLDIGTGDKDVVLTVASGQQGEGMITVPEPSLTVTPEESPIGSAISVVGSGFAADAKVDVTYGGKVQEVGMTDGSGNLTVEIEVPSTAGMGETSMVEVLVRVEESIKASADHKTPDPEPVIPDPVELSAEPSTAVPGQHITITGSGLGDSEAVTEITIGGQSVEAPADAASASDGSIEVTVHLPLDIGTGDKDVVLTVASGQQGEGMITVPEPSLTVTPEESPIGSAISVVGSGFASGERVEVYYGGRLQEAGLADDSGSFTIEVDVPSTAGIGETSMVEVLVRVEESIKASADHKTPDPMITVTPEAKAGGMITITGANFMSLSTLSEVTIGDEDVMPSPAPETDREGGFTIQVAVPDLSAGSRMVTVMDSDGNSATESFTVVVSTPEERFDDLGENLVVVWHYDNATGTWTSYSPMAPELNDLTAVSSGTIVWVHVSEATEFQGQTLNAGWNLIVLE